MFKNGIRMITLITLIKHSITAVEIVYTRYFGFSCYSLARHCGWVRKGPAFYEGMADYICLGTLGVSAWDKLCLFVCKS